MVKLLISGQMRSGTTFIANYLNSQENMTVYADTLVSLFGMIEALDLTDLQQKCDETQARLIISNLIAEGLNYNIDFNPLWKLENPSWIDVLNKSIDILFGDTGSEVVGVKVTKSEEALPAMLDSGFKVIYCVRDPRDVIYSAKNRFAGVSVMEYIDKWKQGVEKILELNHHDNLYILKYESLMMHPERELEQLSTFLGTEIGFRKEGKLMHRNTSEHYTDNSSFGDITELFDAKGVGRWKSVNDNWVITVYSALSKEIAHLNYELGKYSSGESLKYKLFRLASDKARSMRKWAKHTLKR